MNSEKQKLSNKKLLHRGANGNMADFASKFLEHRLEGFEKDMKICLTGIPSKNRKGTTYAYFPALMNCCGMLEYLSSLHAGKFSKKFNINNINDYTKFLPQPDYSIDSIHILYHALRHPIAHRGIASGVWIDEHDLTKGRRIVWKIAAGNHRPAIEIKEEIGVLKSDPPWECSYTHRVHINLGRLWQDIKNSAFANKGYKEELIASPDLLKKFTACMKELYPA